MDVNTEQDYSESAQPFHQEITDAPRSDDADGLAIVPCSLRAFAVDSRPGRAHANSSFRRRDADSMSNTANSATDSPLPV
jgi:hypothetical protein